ncbi:hypothetical protein [Propionicicella superfundia]|uniref:hypothetical protein n=1 Tax=Propionicicella superfundia TaxID=348582 RepID=UPI00040193CA|nr:hypothetical protein [Propionicicella superfundia]
MTSDPRGHEQEPPVGMPDFVAPTSSAWAAGLGPAGTPGPETGADRAVPPPQQPTPPSAAPAPQPAPAVAYPGPGTGTPATAYPAPFGPPGSGAAQPGWAAPAGPPAGANGPAERVGRGLAAMAGAILPGLVAAWYLAGIGLLRLAAYVAMAWLATTLYRLAAGSRPQRGRIAVGIVLAVATLAYWFLVTAEPWWAFGSAFEFAERLTFTLSMGFAADNAATNAGSLIVFGIAYAVCLSVFVVRSAPVRRSSW